MISNISQIIALNHQKKISKYFTKCEYKHCHIGGWNKNINICINCGSIMCCDCMGIDCETCLNCSKLICDICKTESYDDCYFMHICQQCNEIVCENCLDKTSTYSYNEHDLNELSKYCKNC